MLPDTVARIRIAPLAPAKILIADDHPLRCAALIHALRSASPGATVLTASGLRDLESAIGEHPDLDLALLDLPVPGGREFSSLLLLRARCPELPVIVISANDHPPTIVRAQQFGAAGFLCRSAPLRGMVTAIGAVMSGGTCFPRHAAKRTRDDAALATRLARLTPQQMRVLICVADGLPNKQIAHELRLAENTVKVHVTAVLRKLGCHSRTRAAVLLKALQARSTPYSWPNAPPLAAARAPQFRRPFSEPPRPAYGAVHSPRPR